MALIILLGVLLGARLCVSRKIVISVVLPLSGLWILARLAEDLVMDSTFTTWYRTPSG